MLEESARQFNAHGVSLTSLSEIAQNLGVSRAALYHYVEDREDLVFKTYRQSLSQLSAIVEQSAQYPGDALAAVDSIISSALVSASPEMAALSEIGLLNEDQRKEILQQYRIIVGRIAGILQDGGARGTVRRCDFETTARCIISMIHSIPLAERWQSTRHRRRKDVIDLAINIVRMGVALHRDRPAEPQSIDISALIASPITSLERESLREAKREMILHGASQLFNARGIETTSLDEIAALLGTTKRALYRYIGGKDAIVTACYQRAFRFAFHVSDALDRLDLPPFKLLDIHQRTHALIQMNPSLSPLRQDSGFGSLSEGSRERIGELSKTFTEANRRRVIEAQSSGGMRAVPVEDFLLLATGPSAWLSKPLVEDHWSEPDRIANTVADLIRIGLAPLD